MSDQTNKKDGGAEVRRLAIEIFALMKGEPTPHPGCYPLCYPSVEDRMLAAWREAMVRAQRLLDQQEKP